MVSPPPRILPGFTPSARPVMSQESGSNQMQSCTRSNETCTIQWYTELVVAARASCDCIIAQNDAFAQEVVLALLRNDEWHTLVRRAYLWACERLYHELACGYDLASWLVSLGAWDDWRRLAVGAAQGRVLELGYGTGVLLTALAMEGRDIVGVELSPAMQRIAARRSARHNIQPTQVRARAEQLPLAAGTFDTVVATFPAPYILADATLAECRRVLRPGGKLVIVGLWVQAPRNLLLRLVPVFYGAPAAAQTEQLRDHFAQAGLRTHLVWRPTARGEVAVLIAESIAEPDAIGTGRETP